MKSNYRNRYGTPAHIVDAILATLNLPGVELDVCAEEWSNKGGQYFSEEDDALSRTWSHEVAPMAILWMNPPYSDLPTWTAKAAHESAEGQLVVIGLVPDMRSSQWYQDNVENVAPLVLLPDGRINFEPPPDAWEDPEFKTSSNQWPSCVPVWTPWKTGRTEYVRFSRR